MSANPTVRVKQIELNTKILQMNMDYHHFRDVEMQKLTTAEWLAMDTLRQGTKKLYLQAELLFEKSLDKDNIANVVQALKQHGLSPATELELDGKVCDLSALVEKQKKELTESFRSLERYLGMARITLQDYLAKLKLPPRAQRSHVELMFDSAEDAIRTARRVLGFPDQDEQPENAQPE